MAAGLIRARPSPPVDQDDRDDDPDVLFDSSAAVPLVLVDHEYHAAVLDATSGMRRGLAGHAWFETYSVLTRLPTGRRLSPTSAERALRQVFPSSRFLDPATSLALGAELARIQVAGGAVFDALVGAAARQHDRPLISCDKHARRTYDSLGVRVLWPIGNG